MLFKFFLVVVIFDILVYFSVMMEVDIDLFFGRLNEVYVLVYVWYYFSCVVSYFDLMIVLKEFGIYVVVFICLLFEEKKYYCYVDDKWSILEVLVYINDMECVF